jgi:F-type H+-transporting ATPase subunit alpha
MAINLEEDFVGAIIFDSNHKVKEGDIVKKTNKVLSVPVGEEFLGRVLNPLMQTIDGGPKIQTDIEYLVEKKAPSVMEREAISVPLQTGIKTIDGLIPIGRGQRELIIGDRQTGKTSIAIDTIINQKGKNVICIYTAIGQKKSKVSKIIETLKSYGAMEYTTVVLAGSSDGASMSYIAPYSATALAEYFMDQGKDVLIIYDDLSKHAVSYREISLLLKRPPGREAYPGDVFYLHSRLLERSARRNKEAGGGSITSLPIIETQAGDISAYIPTNVISITDGQIFLESGLFNKGFRPAINIGLSVSRVGGSAQIKAIKSAVGKVKLDLAQYRELEAFSQFASDLDDNTRKTLERGLKITELLKQPSEQTLAVSIQTVLFYAIKEGFLDKIELKNIYSWQNKIIETLKSSELDLLDSIEKNWDKTVEEKIKRFLENLYFEK